MSTDTKTMTRAELEQMSCSTVQDFTSRDHRLCDCELTYVRRKHHPALGCGVEIRLCCLAKKVEELAGLPPGTFFLALDFEPAWDWDCEKVIEYQKTLADGSKVMVHAKLGEPSRWLRERLEKKGRPIHRKAAE